MQALIKKITMVLFVLCLGAGLPVLNSAAAEQSDEGGQSEKISINFVDVEVSSIVKIMSELTGRNFVFDDALKGKVTIVAPMKLTVDEALKLFTSSLELKKYTIIPSGKAYKVIPLAQARQSAAQVIEGDTAGLDAVESYVVRLVPLNYIATQDAFTLVQPLISRYGQLSIFGARNALLIVDSLENSEKILSIIKSVDTEPMTEKPEIIYLQHTKAETIAELLRVEARRSGLGTTGSSREKDANGGITADLRLNAIILSLPMKARKNLKRFVAVLDTPTTESSSRINVYYLENAEAVELSRVLGLLMQSNKGNGLDELSSRITITPDKATNALIVMASPADYQGLLHVIQKLDRRPKQVFVEAMITEVKIGKALDLGTKWRLAGVSGGEPIAIGGVGTIDQTEIQKVVNGMAGLSIGGLGNYITVPVTKSDGTTFSLSAPGFAALFSLSQFNDVVNILSTPHILTSDNSEAEIIVGENVPFLSSIEREATTTSQPLLQSIERKDVGITLRIKPKISEGNFVKLDLFQEISALATTTVSGASDLITTKRSARTTVVVRDKQTVVIGGLIQSQKVTNITKVPILGDIPILSWFFKHSSEQDEKTNLLIFITPYIIDDFAELEELRFKKESEYGVEPVKNKKNKEETEEMSMEVFSDPAGDGVTATHKEAASTPKAVKPKSMSFAKSATEKETITVTVKKKIKKRKTEAKPAPTLLAQPGTTITNIRTGVHKKFNRLVIELDSPAKYTVTRRAHNATVEIIGASHGRVETKYLKTELFSISDPKSGQNGTDRVTTLVLTHKKGSRVKNSTLADPYRIIVDVYRLEDK